MKKSILVAAMFVAGLFVKAQPGAGMWTWMNGNPASYAPVYGVQGVPAPGNHPSYAPNPGFWKGKDGKFWLFGTGNLTDTWSFDPVTNQWAWEAGTHNGSASIGTMGVSSSSNRPPLLETPVCWTDTTGNLWMFGGYEASFGPRNQLWKFDVTTKEWVWVRGSASPFSGGLYGIKGVASPINDPAARLKASGWADANNNLWMCLGEYYVGTATFFNDVWKYNISSNEWYWMAGDSAGSGTTPVNDIFNGVGAFDPGNTPAGMPSFNALPDDSGNGYLLTISGNFWKYDVSINQWACLRTDTMRYNPPHHFFCVPSYAYYPVATSFNTLCAKDSCGNFWYREDGRLWQYNVAQDKFTQVNAISGSVPVYGTQGVPDPANSPFVSRGAAAWMDNNGNFWQYGGYDFNPSNFYWVMWKYVPDTNCTSCSGVNNTFADFLPQYGDQCVPADMPFTDYSVNAAAYLWDFGDGQSSTLASPEHTYTAAGTYTVTLITTNGSHTDTAVYYDIEIYDSPTAAFTTNVSSGNAVLTVITNNMSVSGPSTSYLWNFGAGDPDEFANNTSYDYMNPGSYNLMLYVTDNSTGCSDTASSVITVYPVGTGIELYSQEEFLKAAPNPFVNETLIKYSLKKNSVVKAEVYNVSGRLVKTLVNAEQAAGEYTYPFSAGGKRGDAGSYFVKLTVDGKVITKRITATR
ncbi:MAG: hypothetical protein JWO44_1161 [Bacteroidetes bacterium]|nr:hypothetical protein [Bacteroidota bacterium]